MRRRAPGGFTLIEMLVIIVIIMLLMGILAPAASNALTRINRSISETYVNAIGGGVELYRNDFDDYPPSSNAGNDQLPNWKGAQLLALLLLGYGPDPGVKGKPLDAGATLDLDDGRDGGGFRVVFRGKVHGPYAGLEDVSMGLQDGHRVFIDKFSQPVLYYRFEGGYQAGHNTDGPADMDAYTQRDSKYVRQDYILITKGPNRQWDPPGSSSMTDDVQNY